MAAREDVEIATLTSLSTFLNPKVVETIIDAYWQKDGDRPSTYTIELGRMFASIAQEIEGFSSADLPRLNEIRKELDTHSRIGMTEKNLAALRTAGTPDNYRNLINLPSALVQKAKAISYHAGTKAAVLFQTAVAIQILCFAPIRLANLAAIRLEENLTRPGGPSGEFRLVFPHYDVKNDVNLDFPLNVATTKLIDEYLNDHRPKLMRGKNHDFLFPGEAGGHKFATALAQQIASRIKKEIGLKLTPHQFRHLAAQKILEACPGNYELVRRVLGHSSIQTTTRNYIGLETRQANELFGKIISGKLRRAADDGD